MSFEMLSGIAAVFGVCIAAVNIIVEVLKTCWLKKEACIPVAVLITSEVMAFFVAYAYCVLENVRYEPTFTAGVFAGGFFVAYGAMFGYDKLYGELFEAFKNMLKGGKS